jgi:dynein heavy chain, axonemal
MSTSDRVKVTSIIASDIHARDVVQVLIDQRVTSANDFIWQSQLKYSWESGTSSSIITNTNDSNSSSSGTLHIKLAQYSTKHNYEYTGNCTRMIVTPLTDRCYVAITTAMKYHLGSAMLGYANCGKTETVVELARNIGLPCYQFTCMGHMTATNIAHFVKGVVQSGCWGYFDDIHKLSSQALSVMSSMLRSVREACIQLAVPKASGNMNTSSVSTTCFAAVAIELSTAEFKKLLVLWPSDVIYMYICMCT